MIPTKHKHITEEEASNRDYTQDHFGVELRVGDPVLIFREGAEGFTDIKSTRILQGVIKDITVWPTTLADVLVEHYDLPEDERRDPKNKDYADVKTTSRYYNSSLIAFKTFREVIPEYFL